MLKALLNSQTSHVDDSGHFCIIFRKYFACIYEKFIDVYVHLLSLIYYLGRFCLFSSHTVYDVELLVVARCKYSN